MNKIAQELVKIARSMVAGLNRGETIEKDNIRIHRWNSSIRVWDLTNAGRIGKQVDSITIYNLDWAGKSEADSLVETLADNLSRVHSYSQAKSLMQKAVVEINAISSYKVELDERKDRGIDVSPAGFKEITIRGKHVSVEVDYESFTVKDLEDMNNEPTCIPAIRHNKRDVKMFYMWVRDNQSWIQNARFNEVLDGMSKAGIKYHYYCAMD